jgi:hypothetical protein
VRRRIELAFVEKRDADRPSTEPERPRSKRRLKREEQRKRR